MKKALGILTFLMLASVPAMAQGTPGGEVGVGYSFLGWAVPTVYQPPSMLHMNGWNASVEANINRFIGAEAEVNWTRGTSSGVPIDITTAMAGPQIYPIGHHKITPFIHALFGASYFRATFPTADDCAPNCNFTDGDFVLAGGGGVDLTLMRHVAVRVAQLDYEQTRFGLQYLTGFAAPAVAHQNNWKYSAAILFRFGER